MSAVEMGQRIKARRAKLAMLQSDLAKETGLSQAYISRLEKGAAGDNVNHLITVSRALGCRLSYLVGETQGEMLAEVQQTLPNGTVVVVSFERVAPSEAESPDADQAFVAAAIDAVAEKLGNQGETSSS